MFYLSFSTKGLMSFMPPTVNCQHSNWTQSQPCLKMMISTMLLFSLLICSEASPSPKFSISCTMKDTQLAYHKRDHFAEHFVQEGPEGRHACHIKCREDDECDAWTLNTRNGWCGLKKKDTVKVVSARGFISGSKQGFGRFGTEYC